MYIPGKGIKPRECLDVTLLKVPSLSFPSGTDLTPAAPHPHTPDSPMTFATNNPDLDKTPDVSAPIAQGTLGTQLFQTHIDSSAPIAPAAADICPHPPDNSSAEPTSTPLPTLLPASTQSGDTTPQINYSQPAQPDIPEGPIFPDSSANSLPDPSAVHSFCNEPIGPVPRILRPRPHPNQTRRRLEKLCGQVPVVWP